MTKGESIHQPRIMPGSGSREGPAQGNGSLSVNVRAAKQERVHRAFFDPRRWRMPSAPRWQESLELLTKLVEPEIPDQM
jgi:hypothetical protein